MTIHTSILTVKLLRSAAHATVMYAHDQAEKGYFYTAARFFRDAATLYGSTCAYEDAMKYDEMAAHMIKCGEAKETTEAA